MSFKAYLDNIKAKTGKSPEDFQRAAGKADLPAPRVKATQIVSWLKKGVRLGTRPRNGHLQSLQRQALGGPARKPAR